MLPKSACPVIAIEEHYWDEEMSAHYTGVEASRPPDIEKRLHDLGDFRLKEMDEAGIDVQVVSHGAPSAQKLPADVAVAVTRRVTSTATSAGSFCAEGAPCESTCMSMPASSISWMRNSPRSCRRRPMSGERLASTPV